MGERASWSTVRLDSSVFDPISNWKNVEFRRNVTQYRETSGKKCVKKCTRLRGNCDDLLASIERLQGRDTDSILRSGGALRKSARGVSNKKTDFISINKHMQPDLIRRVLTEEHQCRLR